MKRLFLVLLSLQACLCSIMAIPAHPSLIKVQHPDGSSLTLRLIGDEWLHYNTTEDGYTVVKGSDGYYRYADVLNGQLTATSQVAHDAAARQAAERAFLAGRQKYQAPAMTAQNVKMKQMVEEQQRKTLASHRAAKYDYNNFRGLVILVQFNDKTFSREDYPEIVTNMITQENYEGYTDTNGTFVSCTGSVYDYYSDNSDGKFKPQFDIAGPYTVNFSQYDGNDKTLNIVNAALNAADADVDFSQYDGDGNGVVDLVYFVVAGNGSNYSGNDSRLWWPHRSAIYNPNTWSYVYKDGVRLWDFASSVELYGWTDLPSSVHLDGIGTICHEFSHVLGLPDFYDADYAQNGQSDDPGEWSLMAGGSYLNESCTPCGYSLYERYAVGFIDELPLIEAEGSYTLEPLSACLSGFRINTPVENEFFLLENRQKDGFKWDAYLPGSGMLVFRVDRTNLGMWDNNQVNCYANHNYYELLRAGGKTHLGTNYDPFPGTANVTELHNFTSPANLKTWAGEKTKWGLKNIEMIDGVITFDIENTSVLASISLPETATVGEGLSLVMDAMPTPDYAEYSLTWESDDETVATVSQEGVVKGVKEGSCIISVISDNGKTASCSLTVVKLDPISVMEFKSMEINTDALLQLTEAEVVYAYGDEAYVRDATGSVMFYNTGLNLKKNDVINGTLFARVGVSNNMPQVVGLTGSTNDANLTIVSGDEVQPHQVVFEELTPDYYSDYIVLKGATLERRNGNVWAVSGDKTIRLYNRFQIKGVKVPADIADKTFDVYGVYATNVVSGNIINEIEMVQSPVESSQETSIRQNPSNGSSDESPAFDLQGRPVSPNHRGIIIRRGKKVWNK